MCRRKKKDLPDYDDGRTIANMNVDGLPWYQPNLDKNKKVSKEDKPSRKERKAMYRAGYLAYLPQFLAILFGFGVCFLLVWLWLHGWSFS